MKPKRAYDLVDEVAEKLGLPKKTVKTVVTYYWKRVKRSLNEFEYIHIRVESFGTFTIRRNKLNDKAKFMEYRINNLIRANELKNLTYRKYGFIKSTQDKIEHMRRMIECWDKERECFKEIKLTAHGKYKDDLGQPKEDLGGNQELSSQE